MARRLVATLFQSLDGVVSHPVWQFDSFDDDLGAHLTRAIERTDDALMGRVTYQEWEGYWPDHYPEEDKPFADFINAVPKHVASRTLAPADLTWHNAHLIEGDLHDFVRGLKQTEGRDIAVQGSITVVRDLFLAGLLDELTLCTHPVIAGAGTRLFGPDTPTTRLALVDSFRTTKGNVVSTYRGGTLGG